MVTTKKQKSQTIKNSLCKISLIYFFICFTINVVAQDDRKIELQNIELEINNYLLKEIDNYTIDNKTLQILESHYRDGCKEMGIPFDNINFEKSCFAYKEYILRKNYFDQHPEFLSIYLAPLATTKEVTQVCTNGDFENSNDVTNSFVFKRAFQPSSGYSGNLVTNGSDFVPFSLPSSLNVFNISNTSINNPSGYATLVNTGYDPVISSLPRIMSGVGGLQAVKLNQAQNPSSLYTHQYDVVTMSRAFTINNNSFNFDYSVILNDPGTNSSHPFIYNKPFFEVRIYDPSYNILKTFKILANPDDCVFNNSSISSYSGPILWTGWQCGSIDTQDLIGQNVIVEFIVGDCTNNGHFGTVYIDNICTSSCPSQLFPSISLIDTNTTIHCPSSDQIICGTYQLPPNTQYGSIYLNITQNNTIINTIHTPTSLTSNSFCFTVPSSAFGANPSGNFEFQAVGNFIRTCAVNFNLDPIYDNSAFDNGPDVTFINPETVPTFTQIAPICSGENLSTLPTTSLNGITGIWSPTFNNTVTTTYTFTPTSDSCATTAIMTITVYPLIVPTFTQIAPICSGGDLSALPTTSLNGITGTWSPALNNTVTTTYTFTPTSDSCATTAIMTITVYPLIVPTFTQVAPICSGGDLSALPTTSLNGIAGTWSPALNNTTTTIYTFNPTLGSCATVQTMTIIVLNSTPTFNIQPIICYGDIPPILPTTSINGIIGTWSPTTVSNTNSGIYTFTSTTSPSNPCSVSINFSINVINQCGFTISWSSEVSCQVANPRFNNDIQDGPCLRVCDGSTVSYELHGNLTNIDHTDWNITGGSVITSDNTTCQINWNSSNFCALQGVIHLISPPGALLYINRCIDKLEAPKALFSVYPFAINDTFHTCVGTPTYFENYSFANNGDDNLYYDWNFGDGTTSNEFEPVHTYQTNGTYDVVLTVSNGCSCFSRIITQITVSGDQIKIDCPSVVCESDRTHYTIDSSYANCSDLNWQVDGGTIVSSQNNNTDIEVEWNNVNQDGFGYVSVETPSCAGCNSKIKVPVIKNVGTIKGDLVVCEKTQNLYSLPQWPTTNFNWTLGNNTTGAYLILNVQRNEITLQAQGEGTLDLYCSYTNTLLGCGGTAHITIHVQPSINISGLNQICQSQPTNYQALDSNGILVPNISWTVTGPNLFQQQSTDNPLPMTFPANGVYYIETSDPNHCSLNHFKVDVTPSPQPPSIITGPLVVCAGIGVQYSCTPPSGAVAHWSVQNGIIIGSSVGNTVLVAFNPGVNTTTNPYIVSVYYEQDGCTSSSLSTTIQLDKPTIVPLPNSTVCGSTYATYTIPEVHPDSYTWSISPSTAGSIESGQNSNSIHVLWNQTAQTATIKLTIRKCNINYPQFNIVSVTIINTPSVTVTGPTNICSGTPATFSFTTIPAGSVSSVLWNFGDGATSTALSPSYQYHAPTSGAVGYTVTATVSGANGCLMDAVGALPVTVAPSPIVTITPTSRLNLCQSSIPAANYLYSVVMQGGFAATDHIAWYKTGSTTPILQGYGDAFATINVQISGVGIYYATIINSYGCSANSANFEVYYQCPTGTGCAAPYIIDGMAKNTACQEITGTITSMPGSPVSYNWGCNALAGTATTTGGVFHAQDVPPGQYSLTLGASYDIGGVSCSTSKENITVIVPYHADLKYKIECGTGNNYTVTLLDYSTYYAGLTTPINHLYTTDGGGNWHPETATILGTSQYSISLPPGLHTIGIKINTGAFLPCTNFITINLPNKPNAAFSIDPTPPATICAGSPIHVTPTYPQPGYHYVWDFGDNSSNLQPNSVKTYSGGSHSISLTITDQFGCVSPTVSNNVTVTAVKNMDGFFTVSPQLACQGSPEVITFSPYNNTINPTHFIWYQNTVGATPFAVTSSGQNLTVYQTGYYPVYLQDSNGCIKYDTNAPSAAFIPTPDTPVIKGNAIACLNSGVTLSIPVNTTVTYQWYLNGALQPQWNNQTTITDYPTATGVYTYSVIATAVATGTFSCSSTPGSISVTVVDLPNMPQLSMTVASCDPYNVVVSVTNPQTDVGYYWSNGDVGVSTTMTHDGPLQVRAIINECSVKTQLDLPTDLQPLSWIFPKGCYSFCKDAMGTVIGPLGLYEQWQWLENDTAVSAGHYSMTPLTHLTDGSSYAMSLNNGYCALTTGTMSITSKDCSPCKFEVSILTTSCATANEQTIYQTTLTVFNPYTTAAWATFAAPNGEGYFTNNTSSLAPGLNTITLNFIGHVGFNGGTVHISINAQYDNQNCIQQFDINFPTDCENVEDCKFDYKLGEISCVKTEQGIIYHFVLSVGNPYAVSATTSITIPTSFGVITPSSVLSSSGVSTNDFYFYPSAGFQSGGLPLTITSSIGTVTCSKDLEIALSTDCPPAKPCDIKIDEINVKCHAMTNGQYGYTVTLHFNNPYQTTTTIILTAPNGEGYFVPNTQQIPWSASVQTFDFYPTNGFMGDAAIAISLEGHYKDQICFTNFTIDFPKLCCPSCKVVDLDDPKISDKIFLELVPNPASDSTTVYFNFATTEGSKTIVITDLLGRILQQWQPEQSKGNLAIDCGHLSAGQYLVTLKQNNTPIQTAKLIKQ